METPETPQVAVPTPQQEPERTPHGDAVIFGLAAVLVTGLLAVLGHALNLPALPWAIGAGVVALLGAGIARLEGGATTVTAWWAAAFCVWGAWTGWARYMNLHATAPWMMLAAVTVALAIVYPLLRTRRTRNLDALARHAAERERHSEVNRWPRLLERIGYSGVKVDGREETESGYVLGLRLPGSGKVTIRKLRGDVERLEVAADTPRGTLYFEEGETARDVLLYVTTRDFLAETIPYEDDGELMTIQNPIPIGRYEDGQVCTLTLREVAALIVGLRGSGKSNLLNVLLAQLVRCVDVLIFVIDMKYRLVMPWVTPYLEDEQTGMAVDWAATSRDEAEKVLRAFVRGIEARASAGGSEEKIEPDPDRPAVFLVIDEIASIFGMGTGPRSSMEGTTNTQLAGIGTEAGRLGRSEAMDLIAASQRGTVTMVGTGDFKSQFPLRIGLRVQSEADARTVFPDDQEAARMLATMKHEGTGLVQDQDGRNLRVKFYRITPAQVVDIARKYGPMKPGPEHVLEDALGTDYTTRWDRLRATRKAGTRTAHTGAPDEARVWQDITSRLGDVEAAAEGATADMPPPRRRMLEFIGRSAERGVTVAMITSLLESEHMGVDERTVRRWLNDEMARGTVERTTRGVYRERR